MNRCIVTGGTGLIGSRVLPLLARSYEVHATTRRPIPMHQVVHWHNLDLARADTSQLPRQADAIVYLAQSEHFRQFPNKADEIFGVNVEAVQRFLEYCRAAGCRTFVLASTGGVYTPGEKLLRESETISARRDMGFYAATKLCAETLATQYADAFDVVILRFFFVYGPGQAEHMLLPRLVRSVQGGTPITLAGRDGMRLNPTYVDDAAAAVVAAVGLKGDHRINVGGPDIVSIRELAQMIGAICAQTPVFQTNTDQTPPDLVADITRMRQLLPGPLTSLRDGLSQLVESMREPAGRVS